MLRPYCTNLKEKKPLPSDVPTEVGALEGKFVDSPTFQLLFSVAAQRWSLVNGWLPQNFENFLNSVYVVGIK